MLRSKAILILALFSLATAAHAGKAPDIEKVKTGILPGGGFYSVYSVDCGEQTSSIVSTDRRIRWCARQDGQLHCMRKSHDAALAACARPALATRDGVQGDLETSGIN